MKNYLTTFALVLCFSLAHSQDAKLSTQLEFGGLRGIQLSKTFPILKAGGMAQINVTKSFGNSVHVGLGTAYIQLEDESFTPLFIYCKARRKKGNSLFYNTSIGYSKASNSTFDNAIYSQYKGKMYFSPGMGYHYRVNEKWGLTAGINYILQKVDLEQYNSDNTLYHTKSLTLDLIVLKVGISLH